MESINLFDLYAKIVLDTDDYENGLDGASAKTSAFADKLKSGLVTAGKLAASGIAAAGTAIIGFGKIGLDYNKQMETYTTNFAVMLGDVEAAAAKVEELKELGAKTPFELGDLADATQTLLAFNVSADESTSVLTMLGDISLGNAEKLETLTRAYGKMSSSQKVTLEDINMMIDAGFNPLLIVAEETGETMEELYDRISAGEVSFEEIQGAMESATSAGGQFYQGMELASQTLEGMLSTLKDNATMLIGSVFAPITDSITDDLVPSAIEAVGDLADAFEKGGTSGLIDAATDMIGKLLGEFAEAAPAFVDVAVQITDALFDGLTQNSEQIGSGAATTVASILGGILSLMPSMADAGLSLIESLASGLATALPTLMTTGAQAVAQLAITIGQHRGDLLQAGLDLIVGLAEGLLAAIPVMMEAMPEIITSMVSFILGAIPQIYQAGIDLLSAIVDGLPVVIDTATAALPEVIYSIAQTLIDGAPDIASAGVELLIALIRDLPQIIVMILLAIPQIITSITTALSESAGAIAAAGVDLFTSLIKNLPQILDALGEAALEMVAAIKEQLASADFSDIGANMINGLISGFNAGLPGANASIADAIEGMKGKITGATGFAIKSPSRWMRDKFEQVMEGVGVGIERGLPDALSHVSGAIDAMQSGFATSTFTGPTIADRQLQAMNGLTGAVLAGTGGSYEIVLNVGSAELARVLFDPLKAVVAQRGESFA